MLETAITIIDKCSMSIDNNTNMSIDNNTNNYEW